MVDAGVQAGSKETAWVVGMRTSPVTAASRSGGRHASPRSRGLEAAVVMGAGPALSDADAAALREFAGDGVVVHLV